MERQFIGLEHCKCGISWKRGTGYFMRTNDMIFSLESKVVKKGKNAGITKQVPVIHYNDMWDEEPGTVCIACCGYTDKVDGCNPYVFTSDGKTKYARVKVGDAGDMYEGTDSDCLTCGAKHGYCHHFRCNCETCPVCGAKQKACACVIFTTPI